MPPRVTYWTGVWEPSREALSREVAALADASRTRAVVSFSRGQRTALLPRARVLRLSAGGWPALRALAGVIERAGDVTHVFGALDAWHFLRCLGRRPIVFTVAIEGANGLLADRQLYERVSMFAAETEAIRDALIDGGIAPARIRVVRPGVDLGTFAPRHEAGGRFRLLFASTPSDPSEFDGRGIPLLVELARRLPDIEVYCPWRQWGDLAAARQALAALSPPANFIVSSTEIHDMRTAYNSAHAIVCLFANGVGKSAPNSVIEGLACGRPALVSDRCGISRLVVAHGAGVSARCCIDDVVEAAQRLRRSHAQFATRARALAEREFGIDRFLHTYAGLYRALAEEQT